MMKNGFKTKSLKTILSTLFIFSSLVLSGCKNEENENLRKQIEQLTALNAELQALKEQLQEQDNQQIAELTSQIETLNAQISQLLSTNSGLNDDIDELEKLQDEAQAKIEELQALIDAYENAKHTVTFDVANGVPIPPQIVKDLGHVEKPDDPHRDGYTFVKWIDGEGRDWQFFEDTVSGDITLTAVWTVNTYTVTFDLSGGQFDGTYETSYQVTFDTNFDLPKVKRDNYKLNKWVFNDAEVKSGIWKIPSDAKLKCVWAKQQANIIYDFGYGGLPTQTVSVQYGESYTVLAPERIGYTFSGWKYSDGYLTNGKWEFLEDVSVVAQWTPNTYILSLDPNGGMLMPGSFPKAQVTYDSSYTLPVCAPLNESQPFAGWFLGNKRITDQNGNSLENWTMTSNQNLNAKFFHPITCVKDLSLLETYPTAVFGLTNDIDFENKESTQLNGFSGTLIGLGYSLKNINLTSDSLSIGLFKTITDATFEDIKITNSKINVSGQSSDSTYYGGLLASQTYGTTTLRNVDISSIDVKISSQTSNVSVGSLFGYSEKLVINDLTVSGDVKGEAFNNNADVGGIVGQCADKIVTDSFTNKATIYSNSFGGKNEITDISYTGTSGGLAGLAKKVDLTDTYNEGKVESISTKNELVYSGGLIGKLIGKPLFYNSGNKGSVISSGYAGGVIGANSSTTIISGCNNQGNVGNNESSGYAGGIVGRCTLLTYFVSVKNTGTIETNDGISGGLIGYVDKSVVIDECYSEGYVKSIAGSSGGFIGESSTATIRDCYSASNISGSEFVGGFIGINNNANPSISNSYVSGSLEANNDTCLLGGFIGKANYSNISNSFIVAKMIGIEENMNSAVGEYIGCVANKLVSSTNFVDRNTSLNIAETYKISTLISKENLTSEYIKNTLLFDTSKWVIRLNISQNIFPILSCFADI